jgi:hypothetical protein
MVSLGKLWLMRMSIIRRAVAPIVLVGSLLAGGQAQALLPTCDIWLTMSTTAKQYSTCSNTVIGPWTSPAGGCLQWVSWHRTQRRVDRTAVGHWRYRELLENEVRARFTVTVGPVAVHKTQTMPGSHTTTVLRAWLVWPGPGGCTPLHI